MAADLSTELLSTYSTRPESEPDSTSRAITPTRGWSDEGVDLGEAILPPATAPCRLREQVARAARRGVGPAGQEAADHDRSLIPVACSGASLTSSRAGGAARFYDPAAIPYLHVSPPGPECQTQNLPTRPAPLGVRVERHARRTVQISSFRTSRPCPRKEPRCSIDRVHLGPPVRRGIRGCQRHHPFVGGEGEGGPIPALYAPV